MITPTPPSNDAIRHEKSERLRAAYEEFLSKLQKLREKRLEYMKSAFKDLDAKKIEEARKQLTE